MALPLIPLLIGSGGIAAFFGVGYAADKTSNLLDSASKMALVVGGVTAGVYVLRKVTDK